MLLGLSAECSFFVRSKSTGNNITSFYFLNVHSKNIPNQKRLKGNVNSFAYKSICVIIECFFCLLFALDTKLSWFVNNNQTITCLFGQA